jgi:cytochrome P450
MFMNGKNRPPGPKGLPFLGIALSVRANPLGVLTTVARKYGDIVRFIVAGQERVLLNHPDFIEQVLVVQQAKFHKSELTRRVTGRLLGQGLLISEGDFWRRQRRLAQPSFHRSRINEYGAPMTENAEAWIRRWRDGDKRDLASEMMQLTLGIAVRTLFGTTLPGEAQHVGEALEFLMRYQLWRQRSPLRLPETWPTPKNRRAIRELDFLNSLVYRIIEERRSLHGEGNDLLSLLMSAMDDDGSQMTPQQLRDETMTLFLAGHETTALLLGWTWYLLAENRAAEERLHEELSGVLGGRTPQVSDLTRLPYLQAVLQETLRLYPPAYITARTSIDSFSLGGYDFGKDTTVLMAQWVTHRDARFFEAPEEFRPERWLEAKSGVILPSAYFPFGDGPRRCIGQGFATLEAALVVATIAQRFRLRLAPGQIVQPEPLITLRFKHGLRMNIHSRDRKDSAQP